MPAWVIAGKDLRLLLRDRRAAVIMLVMPLLFILILGVALGESFGQKPDDRLRISVVLEDTGVPDGDESPPGVTTRKWADLILRDLQQTAGVRVEVIPDRATADKLIRASERSAVLVFGPDFSKRVNQCSFLEDKYLKKPPGINPFFRDGVDLAVLNVSVLRDPTQIVASAIIEQVAQVTLLRVVMPWMIGRGFEEVAQRLPAAKILLPQLFAKYDLTAKTWARLTRSKEEPSNTSAPAEQYAEPVGGLLARGSMRYQVLVPSYIVTFAFFLVLTCGWLFVTERRQGTMLRLRAAPLRAGQILLGKLVPCLVVSLSQGFFLLIAGKLVFGMNWGTQPAWLIGVVIATSIAATGLALCVASLAKTESQVAVYGTLLVLILAGVSGALMPRDLMPESMRFWSKLTPHAWALDAYSQLLLNPQPEVKNVATACGVLSAFGIIFTLLGWWRMKLE